MSNKISIAHKKLIIDTNIIRSALHTLFEAAKKLADAVIFYLILLLMIDSTSDVRW